MSPQTVELEEVVSAMTDDTLEGMVMSKGEKMLLLYTPPSTGPYSCG
jgi:hypothetical protein